MTHSAHNKRFRQLLAVPMTRRILIAAVAVVVLAGVVTGIVVYRNRFAVATTVSLDAKPGVVLTVNKNEKVLDVRPLNEDGRAITGERELAGSDLDAAVNELIGSMLRHGYLNDLANSLLVSVDNDDAAAGAALQARLSEQIGRLLNTDAFTGAVLSQTVKKDNELKKLADTYDITLGKAQLIRQITTQNTAYTFGSLVPLSINELNLLSESGKLHLENVSSSGTASDKSYIGEENAKALALEHAGVQEADISFYRCEMDYADGALVYELDFVAGGYDYDYEISALIGSVVRFEKERDDDGTTAGTATNDAAYIGEAAAKAAALKHAGVQEAALDDFTCRLDRDGGTVLYDIGFSAAGYEYDYEVNAATGKVVSYEREYDDDAQSTAQATGTTAVGAAAILSPGEARAFALAHFGVKVADIRSYEYELDRENGVTVYEISFRSGNYEYECEVDAKTGKVLRSEKNHDD